MVLYIDKIPVDLCCSILIDGNIEAPTTYHTVKLPLINSGKLVPHTRNKKTEKKILCNPTHLIDQSDQSTILSFNRTKGYLLWFLYTIHFRRKFNPSSPPHHFNLFDVTLASQKLTVRRDTLDKSIISLQSTKPHLFADALVRKNFNTAINEYFNMVNPLDYDPSPYRRALKT